MSLNNGDGNMLISNCSFLENEATEKAGAIYFGGVHGDDVVSALISNSKITTPGLRPALSIFLRARLSCVTANLREMERSLDAPYMQKSQIKERVRILRGISSIRPSMKAQKLSKGVHFLPAPHLCFHGMARTGYVHREARVVLQILESNARRPKLVHQQRAPQMLHRKCQPTHHRKCQPTHHRKY